MPSLIIISSGVRANDLCSQAEASREELELHRLQQSRKACRSTALLLHLGQEGRHLTQGLQTHLIKDRGMWKPFWCNQWCQPAITVVLYQKKTTIITSARCCCCRKAKVMAFGSAWPQLCPPASVGEEGVKLTRLSQTNWNTWFRIGCVLLP